MESPSSEVYSTILSGDIKKLWDYPTAKLKPFLPFLCDAATVSPSLLTDELTTWSEHQERLHSLLCELEEANRIIRYLQLDFTELRSDAMKEQHLIRKLSPEGVRSKQHTENALVDSVEERLPIEFERASEERRFRLVVSEILRIMSQV